MPDETTQSGPSARQERERRRRNARLVLLGAVALLVVLLGVDNSHDVPVEYLFGEANISLVWVIVVSLIAGAILERAYSFVRGRRRDD